jgi:hydrogenase maturation protease
VGQLMTRRILVAGVGNVFLRDDAFGVEVVKLLAERPQPPGVQIKDYGIRGVHLVYELLDGYDLFVLVDAAPRGEAPGTVSVLEVELPSPEAQPVIDAHSLTPDAIFGLLSSLGGHPGRNLVVACEPAEVDAGMGLTDPVREALPHAVRAVEEILAQALAADVPEPRVSEADLSEADLSEADLSEADLSEADLSEADVSEAADEQECMADLTRHLDEPTQEGGAQDAEQADQGGSHRGGAGPGG